MGRINVRVDEDLLEEVDSHGDVRSEVVRNALKKYLRADSDGEAELEDAQLKVKQSGQDQLSEVVESIVNEKIEQDIYPRLGNIYDKLDDEPGDEDDLIPLEIQVRLDPEIYDFYDNYTHAFETSVAEITTDLLEEKAHELSDEFRYISQNDPSWTVERDEDERDSE